MGVALRLRAPNFSSSSLQQRLSSSSSQRVSASSSLRPASLPAGVWQLPSLPLLLKCRSKRADDVVVRAADGAGPGPVKEEEEVDRHVLQFCSLQDKAGKRTIGELEAEFLEALQSFYYEGKPIMSNEEFDNLKEELMWEGSKVVMLSSDEQKFMEASLAYQARKPILSDEEYDKLKRKLKKESSIVAIEGPRCSLRSRKVVSDSTVDYLKMTLLNLPAVLVALGLVFFLDDLTGFEITYLLELPEPYSFLFTWFIVLPTTYLIARSLTNVILKDALILKGPCPNCGADTMSFFGTILTVESGGSVNNVKCEKCGSKLLFDSETRLIELDPSPPEPPKEKKVAAKKPVVNSAS
jgi:DNA-directed RNA polymerase subunit RPC12/RpoP